MRRLSHFQATLIVIRRLCLRIAPFIGLPETLFDKVPIKTKYETLFSGKFEIEIVDEDNIKHNSVANWTFSAGQHLDGSYSKGVVTGYLITESAKIEFSTIGSEVEMDIKFGTRLSMGDVESRKILLTAISESIEHLDGMELRIPAPKISKEKIKPGFDLRKKDER